MELHNKYLKASEQNLFPVTVLQERLQQVANEKNTLEQKKGQFDTKVIPPDLVHLLLEKFLEVHQSSNRGKKKQLFQFLVKRITIGGTEGRSRHVNKVELEFDFMKINISK